jgi:hypothetical protein
MEEKAKDVTPADLSAQVKQREAKANSMLLRRKKLNESLPLVRAVAAKMGFPVSKKAGTPYKRGDMKQLIDDIN